VTVDGLPAGVPAPVRRHLEALDAGSAPVEALSLAGSGSVRQPLIGPLDLWLPMSWEARLAPGREFVWHARVRLLGLPLRSASDEFRGDRGRLAVGRRSAAGDGIDRTEYAVLWAWTLLLAPREAVTRPGVVCEPVDPATARVVFPFRDERWEATLRFDPGSGLLARLETHRFEPRSGFPLRWTVEVERYAAFAAGTCPASVLTRWEQEPAVRLLLERVETGLR
jgi:hypothetical protein